MMIDKKAPLFCLTNQNNEKKCLKDMIGHWIVLYFYPKDNTSGCTREALGFTESLKKFQKLDTHIIGISPDSAESHKKFEQKHALKITLLTDPEHKVLEKYGVWQLKKMYGREYYGVVRSTFLIDPSGKIVESWEKVKVNGHVDVVLEKLKNMR